MRSSHFPGLCRRQEYLCKFQVNGNYKCIFGCRIRWDLTALKKYLMLLSCWAGAKAYNAQLHTSKYTDETSETSMPHPGTWGPLKKIHMCTVSKASVFPNIFILWMICYVIRWWFFGQCINLLWYACVLYKYIYVLYVLKKQTPENRRLYYTIGMATCRLPQKALF